MRMSGCSWIARGAKVAASTVILLSICALAPAPTVAQDDQVTAYRIPADVAATIDVDGRIAEAIWEAVSPMTGFRQQDPIEGAPASERTEVRIAYDDDALYIAVRAFDSEPEDVVARLMQRDKLLQPDLFGGGGLTPAGDDAVAILLDPFHDHRNGMVFATNANGAQFEALLTDEGSGVNVDWRGVWDVAGRRTAEG